MRHFVQFMLMGWVVCGRSCDCRESRDDGDSSSGPHAETDSIHG